MPDIFISTADAARDNDKVRTAIMRASLTGERVIINETGSPSSGSDGALTFDDVLRNPARGIEAGNTEASK